MDYERFSRLSVEASDRAGKQLPLDKRAIFTAASHAQKAADYLHGLQPKADTAIGDDMREAA